MTRKPVLTIACAALLVGLNLGGCANLGEALSLLDQFLPERTITVQVINETSFWVDPHIRFDDDDGDFDAFIAGVFGGSDDLATGLVAPDELVEFQFACDELGLIFADEAEQLGILNLVIAEVDETDVLQREEEFDCGDLIRFRFVGDYGSFGVIVSVNGNIVDSQ